jgi:four helix bundle protein
MDSYRSLAAWQRAHDLAIKTLQATDSGYHPRSRALFDQLKRAAISVEANIVEGYALRTPLLFRRHLRIALGSAAEAECLTRLAQELGYLPEATSKELRILLDGVIRTLVGFLRKPVQDVSNFRAPRTAHRAPGSS